MRSTTRVLFWVGFLSTAINAQASDWITAPSYYTHDPQTSERVRQYTPIGPYYVYSQGDYQRSGYRHTRSSLQVGRSADHLHIVEQFGQPVRPYGEWRHPYRPYSVPYHLWGPPFAGGAFGNFFPQAVPYGVGGQRGGGGGGHPGGGPQPGPGGAWGQGHARGFGGNVGPRPADDGRYAPYRNRRLPDHLFYNPPMPGTDFTRPGPVRPPAPAPAPPAPAP